MSYHKDGKEHNYNSIIKYALDKEKIADNDLFRLKEYSTAIFVSKKLKKQ